MTRKYPMTILEGLIKHLKPDLTLFYFMYYSLSLDLWPSVVPKGGTYLPQTFLDEEPNKLFL